MNTLAPHVTREKLAKQYDVIVAMPDL